jgi:hypothetical protein
MLTPTEIIKRAERKYRSVLRAWLKEESVFPMAFPVGKPSANLDQRRRQIDQLRQRSKEITGQGYNLIWTTVNKRDLGKQTLPHRAIIPNIDDYLRLLRRRDEFKGFKVDVAKITQAFPQLQAWMIDRPQDVIEFHGQWDDILLVCKTFCQNPRPNVYIRELPIAIHTKFIESHTRILYDLLNILLPDDSINSEETTFTGRFGLRDKPVLVRLRVLEEQLDWQFSLRIDDLSLPVDQLAHLLGDHLRPKHVIIVENLINFLTLPKLANSIGLFGKGFGVHILREVDWLTKCNIIYWGDIDAHGFQILSDLRVIFPHTQSVMMDRSTFDTYSSYVVEGKATPNDNFEGLNLDETDLARHVRDHNLRLEQEHIDHQYAVIHLQQMIHYGY